MTADLGLSDPTIPPNLDDLDRPERIAAMVEWFMENFEDPAEETPYESAEGGYQYIWGGPFDARDEISQYFPEASDEEVEEAVDEIEAEGTVDWAPAGSRIRPEPIDDEDRPASLKERLTALRGQLDDVEAGIRRLPSYPAMMGHNHPPEELKDYITEDEKADALEGITSAKRELDRPNPSEEGNFEVIKKAEQRLGQLATKLWSWAKAIGKLVVAGVVGQAGKDLFEDPSSLATKLDAVVSTLSAWAQHLHSLF